MKNYDKIFNISNFLSLLRLFSAILFWYLLEDFNNSAVRWFLVIFAVAMAATDFLDGILARKLNQVTEVGKIIDPVADKVVIGAIFLKFFMLGIIPLYFFLLVIIRDILILLAAVFIKIKYKIVLQSNFSGKITVVFISLVILLKLLLVDESSIVFLIVLYTTIALIFLSLIVYSIRAFQKINSIRTE